ncbi:MAG: transglutaminase domain-containing protein [Bacteroidales bacterium]|nr:transglutaminase domain-containing protein [Bacteroidales bacterium]
MKKQLIIILSMLLAACTHEPKQEAFTEEKAMEFLYQYMPLGDSVDYTEDYFQECVQYAFKAKEELPWGDSVPEREFKHFVLPPRVNNENLDRFRATYYEELRNRVKDLSMYEAVLEVNHWCHEHVNYKGSDSRTSAPMATVKTSWGRCGEESTLLVTALRTVGIPARQVYTPRWAHCDDNHAWVEAWVDGEWHFLGACEPEPVLDLGWFNEPASRALLLHTRVFGDYDGPEEVISRNSNYTEINVVDNYGKTAKTTFTILDANGNPLPDITVEFKIYNYAEFCTVVRKTTDENGQTWLTAGLGCMMVYASSNGQFGFQVFRPGEQEEIAIILDHNESSSDCFEFDMVPPAPSANIPEVTPEMRAENDRRVKYEDSIRNAYIADCKKAQQELIANTGNKTLCSIYEKTWGNYQTIADFMDYAREQGEEVMAVRFLESLSDKDLRDITLEVLIDHFEFGVIASGAKRSVATPKGSPTEREVIQPDPNIYSPRISNEMIVPWRKALSEFPVDNVVEWVKQNIEVNDDLNPQRIPISPLGVLKVRKADRHSRDIFFVALARSHGIAAQINPVNGNVQYYDKDQWINVDFEAAEPTNNAIGYLDLQYKPNGTVADPKYYTHFSIKKFDGNSFKLLAYDAKDPGIDDGMTLSTFDHPTPLDEGYYILTSGTRLDDGTALTHSEFFTIKAGETTKVKLVLRQLNTDVEVLGQLKMRPEFLEDEDYYIIGYIDQGSEPTTHAMQDIAAFRDSFEAKGIPMFFIFRNDDEYEKFLLKDFQDLPNTITPYIDEEGALWKEFVENLELTEMALPIFVIVNDKNEVIFIKQGYSIGLGEQLLKYFL